MSFISDAVSEAKNWMADRLIGEGEAENKKIYKAFEKIKEPHEKNPKKQDYEKVGVSEYELVQQSQFYYNSIYFTASDKEKMLKEYREMANYPEVADALDDLCDEAIAQDEEGEVMHLQVNNEKILQNENMMKNIQNEYNYVIELMDFHNNAFTLFRKFYVEAELFAELIIDPDNPAFGLKKVLMLPPETMFCDYDEYENVKGFRQRIDANDERVRGLALGDNAEKRGIIEFKNTQVAYVNSGIFTKNQTDEKIVLSYLERAKVAYRQLKWMEDSLVIYRIVRSPERRVFYIDVGQLPKKKAEEYMNEIIRRYRQRKIYNPQTGEIDVGRNVLAMTEDFWLPTRGGVGPKVENLQGGASLGEIGDVRYFQKKLYKALKVPQKRVDEDAVYMYQGHEGDQREEIKFAKYVQRVRTRFIDWFIDIFRAHLKLKGLWDKYHLEIKDFHFIFNEENEWRESKELQNWTTRLTVYKEMLEFENKDFSRTWLKKNILKMSDEEIEENDDAILADVKKHLEMDKKMNDQRKKYGVGPDGQPMAGNGAIPDDEKDTDAQDKKDADAMGAPQIDKDTGAFKAPKIATSDPNKPKVPFWAKKQKPKKTQLNT